MHTIPTLPNEHGFTFIELLVVVAIIALLVAIAVPMYQSVVVTAEEKVFEANHKIGVSAVHLWLAQNGDGFPESSENFEAFIQGGLSGMDDEPVPGATYEWNGTALQSSATIGGNALTLE